MSTAVNDKRPKIFIEGVDTEVLFSMDLSGTGTIVKMNRSEKIKTLKNMLPIREMNITH